MLHLRLPHLRLDLILYLLLEPVRSVQLVMVSMKTWLHGLLSWLQNVQLDERVDVLLRLEAS